MGCRDVAFLPSLSSFYTALFENCGIGRCRQMSFD